MTSTTAPLNTTVAVTNAAAKPSIGDIIKEAMVKGGKTALADEAGEILINMVQATLGKNAPDFLKTPDGKEISKFGAAMAVIYSVDVFTSDPEKQEALRQGCTLVMEASARDFFQPKIAQLKPFVEELVTSHKRSVSQPVPQQPPSYQNGQGQTSRM